MTQRTPLAAALAALAMTCAAPCGAASSPRASLTVTPTAVRRGGSVLVRGSAGSCPLGDVVTILSRAFPAAHRFAGVPAVLATVRAHGLFAVRTRIPARRRPGRYVATARCGGGNFGVEARIVVLR